MWGGQVLATDGHSFHSLWSLQDTILKVEADLVLLSEEVYSSFLGSQEDLEVRTVEVKI